MMIAGAMSVTLVLAGGLLTGCQNGIFSDDEKIDFMLPSWPQDYPQLSRWQITVLAADWEKEFYLQSGAESFSLEVQRNKPLCLTAAPLTLLADAGGEGGTASPATAAPAPSESRFFKPAGTVYPCSAAGDFYSDTLQCPLTWEEGFTAATMQKIIKSRKQTGISSQNLNAFLMEFNWKKMSEKIRKNIADSIASFENPDSAAKPKFYNPWQIDSSTLLDNLTFAIFEAKYLNTTYIFTVTKEAAKIPAGSQCYSSFIPENQLVEKYGVLTLKKKTPQTYLLDKTYAVTLTATSAKNVSADFTYMPILIEDYEHPE